jgi:hypothetical protein
MQRNAVSGFFARPSLMALFSTFTLKSHRGGPASRWGASMKKKFQVSTAIRTLISLIILLVGLSSAAYIYRTTDKRADDVLGYEVGGEGAYSVDPGDSKMYQRDLELYGGRANVLLDELRRWLVSLWHGKTLAVTVALISLLIAFLIFRSSRRDQS